MKDVEFWAEVKANLREAYASALHWQERARVAREQWRVRHASIY